MERDLKLKAQELIDRLPEGASWDDLMHEIYVRQAIESGLADSDADRTTEVEDLRRRFKLTK